MSYGMIGYVVPHTVYPSGYHCNPKLPLPFINVASQKGHIAIYHMGITGAGLSSWFEEEWKKISPKKLDMNKSCIRFKKPEDVPVNLFGKLISKISVKQWIDIYERYLTKRK